MFGVAVSLHYKVKNQEKYMIASALHEEGVVVCIHDDYCNHVGTAEISQILLEISVLVSSSYSNALPETGELQNISQ